MELADCASVSFTNQTNCRKQETTHLRQLQQAAHSLHLVRSSSPNVSCPRLPTSGVHFKSVVMSFSCLSYFLLHSSCPQEGNRIQRCRLRLNSSSFRFDRRLIVRKTLALHSRSVPAHRGMLQSIFFQLFSKIWLTSVLSRDVHSRRAPGRNPRYWYPGCQRHGSTCDHGREIYCVRHE